ncbi:MAG TPA: response regulator, partial [Rhizobacter sp.]|nr:response regulator [Rhizobacter sp.]
MIRVLLADDHPVVRNGYLQLLEQAGGIQVAAQAGDADAAYAAFLAQPLDVIVTDLAMPAGGGLDLMRRVLARDSTA